MTTPNRTLTATVNGVDPMTVELVGLPDESIDVQSLVQRTHEMLDTLVSAHGSRFPWGSKGDILYEKYLEGRAFAVVSAPILADIEDTFNKGQRRIIARLLVRRFNPVTRELLPAQEARLQGGYVLSQLRGMTEHDLVGSYLWTLARDEDDSPYQRGDGWEYPRKLAIFNPDVDVPTDASLDQSWAESINDTAKRVAALADQGTTIMPTRGARK